LGLSKHGIAMSWNLPVEQWFLDHSPTESLENYLKYPGKTAFDLLNLCLENDLWGSALLNINLPENSTQEVVFTHPSSSINNFFMPVELNQQTMTFSYPGGVLKPEQTDLAVDFQALQAGKITITPCRADFLDPEIYAKTKQKSYRLAQ
jgi:broad specificity polyphosphatase/5'/3'-nucleotidase SurE